MKVKIFSLEGNRQLLDGGSMFGNAPRAVWEKWCPPDSLGRIELACRSLLIQIEGKNILLEAGIGQFFEPKLADRYGVTPNDRHLLMESLQKIEIEPNEIDIVVLSHLHFDHIGGIVPGHKEFKEKNELLFKNATYITSAEAYNRALNPHPRDRASFIPQIISLLRPKENLVLIEDVNNLENLPKIIRENFSFLISNGHTPGQLLSTVKGQKKSIFFCGDLIPGTPWVHLPITMGYDRYPELLIDEKNSLYGSIDLERTILFFTHDYLISGALIEKNEKGKFTPVKSFKEFNNVEL